MNDLVDRIARMKQTMSYSELSAETGVSRATLWRILNKRDHHISPEVRRRLSDRNLVLVEACPTCNVVHIGRCPASRKERSKKRKTPGGWVNARDPKRAARLIVSRAEYPIKYLIHELVVIERKREREEKNASKK